MVGSIGVQKWLKIQDKLELRSLCSTFFLHDQKSSLRACTPELVFIRDAPSLPNKTQFIISPFLLKALHMLPINCFCLSLPSCCVCFLDSAKNNLSRGAVKYSG